MQVSVLEKKVFESSENSRTSQKRKALSGATTVVYSINSIIAVPHEHPSDLRLRLITPV